MISHEREYTIFSLNVCSFTYLEPLEDLDLHTGLETRPVVSWAPREVLRISIRIIRKLMGAGGNTLFNANPEGSGGGLHLEESVILSAHELVQLSEENNQKDSAEDCKDSTDNLDT